MKSVRSCGCINIQSLLVCVCVCVCSVRGTPRTENTNTHINKVVVGQAGPTISNNTAITNLRR
jgi:hypothetical protein